MSNLTKINSRFMPKLISGFILYVLGFIYYIMDILKIFQMQEPVLLNFLPKKGKTVQEKKSVTETELTRKKTFINPIKEIFRMQEPVSKDLLAKKEESDQFKGVIHEKDDIIKDKMTEIKDLQTENVQLKKENASLLEAKCSFEEVMLNYDDFFKKIWAEREQLLNKNSTMDTYLENLECSYNELIEKYQKAKEIILELKQNQDTLKKELGECRETVKVWEKNYVDLKEHSEMSIAGANMELLSKENENIQEISKLKAKIIERQAKINDLEKMLKSDTKPSIYAPLRNRISAK